MADWLRWYGPDESSYKQEAVDAVRARARRILPIFKPLAQPVPVSELEAKRTIAKLRPMISNTIARAVICQELIAMIGRRFTMREAKKLACRVAGSTHTAASGSQVYLLSGESPMRECLGIVRNVVRGEEFQGEQLIELQVVISNGPFCADMISLQFKLSGLQRYGKWFGIVNRRSDLKLKNAMGFVDVRMICRLEREMGQTTCLGVTVPTALESYNRNIAKARWRKFSPCPYRAQHDCDVCPVGKNQCTKSVHYTITHYELKGSTDEQTVEPSDHYAATDAES